MNFKFSQNLSPSRTPSQVWIFSELLTGIVPSPDSILVRSCPLAFRFGWLSTRSSLLAASWGEKILASPQGAVLINKWNLTWDFTLNPFPSGFSSKIESLALPVKNRCQTRELLRSLENGPGFRWSSRCVYKKSQRQRLATISAWVSFRLLPRSLMCSPFMHLVPVVTPITDTSSIADPVVMTTPAKTFLPECAGLLAIKSENFSSTKLQTNCYQQVFSHAIKFMNKLALEYRNSDMTNLQR